MTFSVFSDKIRVTEKIANSLCIEKSCAELIIKGVVIMFRPKKSFHNYKYPILCLLIAGLFLSSTFSVSAVSYPRQVTLELREPEVVAGEWPVLPSALPVLLDGEWYAAVGALSPFLGFDSQFDPVEGWLQLRTEVSADQLMSSDQALELNRTKYQIQGLQQQIQEAKENIHAAEREAAEDEDEDYYDIGNLGDFEDFFADYFGWLAGIRVRISIDHLENSQYEVILSVDADSRSDFQRLRREMVEDYIVDLFSALLELYDENAELEGIIRTVNGSREKLVEFESFAPRGGALDIRFAYTPGTRSSVERRDRSSMIRIAEDIEEELTERADSYNDIEFSYEARGYWRDVELDVFLDDENAERYEDWLRADRETYLERLARLVDSVERNLPIYGRLIRESDDRELDSFTLFNRRIYDWERAPDFDEDDVDLDDWYDGGDWQYGDWRRAHVTRRDELPEDSIGIPYDPTTAKQTSASVRMYPANISVNGVPFTSRESMFLWQDQLYLPVGELADALYMSVEVNEDRNLISFSPSGATGYQDWNTPLNRLSENRQKVATLRGQLEDLQQDLDAITSRDPEVRMPYRYIGTITAMRGYLRDYFEEFEDIPMSIQFSRLSGNRYRLRISYDTEDFEAFDDISRIDIESWVDDMVYAIREYYDESASVGGWIRSMPYDSQALTSINFRTVDDDLTFEYEDHGGAAGTRSFNLEEMLRHLRRYLDRYDGVRYDYEGEMIRRDVELWVLASESRFMDLSPERKRDYLMALQDELESLYDRVRVDGFIASDVDEDPFFRFALDRGELSSVSLMEDLQRDFNRYDRRYEDLRFEYVLTQQHDGTVRMRMNGDFSVNEEEWESVDADDFANWVEDLQNRAESVLNRNVSVLIRDSQGREL